MKRVPEPELMNDPAQAAAYARADFAAVNQSFVERFLELAPTLEVGRVLDLGCGPADILIRLVRARPGLHVTGVDGAAAMVELARHEVGRAGLSASIELEVRSLPSAASGHFDAVLSNSLLHHLHDPEVLWEEVRERGRGGASVLIMDLRRPTSVEDVDRLVTTYAEGESPLLIRDFRASLCAAFTGEEVLFQLERAGLSRHLRVSEVGDRHLEVRGRLPT